MIGNINQLENMIERRNMFKAMRTEYIKEYIQEAHAYYKNYNINDEFIYKAINILSRFLYSIHPEWPREKYGFYSAALYIVLHTPTNKGLNRYQSKKDFIECFNKISLNSLDWYINRIQDALEMYRIHDNRLRSFWLDEQALESQVINRIIKEKFKRFKQMDHYSFSMMIEDVLQIIIEKIGLIPKQFRRDFWQYISKKIEGNSKFLDS